MFARSKSAIFPFFSRANPKSSILLSLLQFKASISRLKVVWHEDPQAQLDQAIKDDKNWQLCARVVREVLNEPGQVMPLQYLEKRRRRLRLPMIQTFLTENPGLLDTYVDRIKPKGDLVTFLRASDRLNRFLEAEKKIYEENELLIISKLCKLLMMAKDRVISAHKLVEVKREFGFPDDFLVTYVPKYPEYFRLHGAPGEGKSFLELVSWNDDFAKSVIEKRAEERSRLEGIRVWPSFNWNPPPKKMREWIRGWMELSYISPYDDVSHLDQASPEMEKRMAGVLHELLSLSVCKRIPVPTLGKFCEEYRFSNAFLSALTRLSGIFYMSKEGGVQTAVLREAYRGDCLIDCDPLLQIRSKFLRLLDEGRPSSDPLVLGFRKFLKLLDEAGPPKPDLLRSRSVLKDMELMAATNKDMKLMAATNKDMELMPATNKVMELMPATNKDMELMAATNKDSNCHEENPKTRNY